MTTTSDAGFAPDLSAADELSRWGIPGGSYFGSQWQQHDLSLQVRNPEDGKVVACVSDSMPRHVDTAVTGVRTSVESTPWPVWARREALTRASELLRSDANRFAAIISTEGSKTIAEGRKEVARTVETLRLSANATSYLTGETLPLDDTPRGVGKVGWYTRHPVGIVAAITPFNDPLNLVAHKLGPALVGGNGVVLKPASTTPLTALALLALLLEAGVPGGRVAVLCGGPAVGEALVTHQQVNLVSFTGGVQTASRITSIAGPKKMLMELGGNNAVLVCADADPDVAASSIVAGAFSAAGQNCLSVQRVYVAERLFEQVLDLVSSGARQLRMGPKADQATEIGPLISDSAAQRVESWVNSAITAGAQRHAGGERQGTFHPPTVLTGVSDDAEVNCEEVFGPVVTLHSYSNVADAIRLINAPSYALQTGIFTRSVSNAMSIAEGIHSGSVIINETSDFRIDAMPFGGFKRSGIGREGVRYSVEAMTETKNTIINTEMNLKQTIDES